VDAHDADREAPVASVIVPAHNEEARGFTCLKSLGRAARELNFHVIVVCNGCTDQTASLARAEAGVDVIELDVANKSAALNEGDLVARGEFPRIYLDADVTIDLASLSALARAGNEGAVLALAPTRTFDTSGSPWLIRRYFEGLETIPFLVASDVVHLDGRGLYVVTQEGRGRFGEFPALLADDTFFDRMFDRGEKRTVEDARCSPTVPSSFRQLLREKARTVEGAWQLTHWLAANRPDALATAKGQPDPRSSWIHRVRYRLSPADLLPQLSWRAVTTAGVYVAVESLARITAWLRKARGASVEWR
jgi:glycosyltransferase involved in cell wall biosynthesis